MMRLTRKRTSWRLFGVFSLCWWCKGTYSFVISLESRFAEHCRRHVFSIVPVTSSGHDADSGSDDNSDLDSINDESLNEKFILSPFINDETSSPGLSKLKWKKKGYLLLQDVSARIQRQDKHAVRHAEQAVRRLERLRQRLSSEDSSDSLLLQAYNLWIHAVSKSNMPQKQELAEEILKRTVQVGLTPNIVTYSSVMDAYAQSGNPKAAERLLLEWIEQEERQQSKYPTSTGTSSFDTTVACDVVLNAWAQRGTWQGAIRAQEILELLQEHEGFTVSAHSYATTITAFANSRGGREAAERAQALLDRLLTRTDISPDIVVFNAALHAWATSGDAEAGTQALKILKQMQELASKYDCRPDIISYNTLLSCWSHSGHENAAIRAQQILERMRAAHQKDPGMTPAPNTVSYNTVLHAWSKSKLDGAAVHARKLLSTMMEEHDEIAPEPDVYSFTSVQDCLAKSKEPNKAVQARKLLDQLIELYESTGKPSLKPSQVPFNAVLNAAAFSAMDTTEQEQRNALQVAVQTFSLMRSKGVQPDMISYGNLLKAMANLIPAGSVRSEMALQVFGKCCEDGMVGDLVWNEIRRAVPAKLLSQQMSIRGSIRSMTVRDLPRQWRRNSRVRPAVHKYKKHKQQANKKKKKDVVAPPVRRMPSLSETSYQSGRDL